MLLFLILLTLAITIAFCITVRTARSELASGSAKHLVETLSSAEPANAK